jgi:hypothetical protein
MVRFFVGASLALLFCVGSLLADRIEAKIKKVDLDKNSIVVTVDGKEKTMPVAKDATISSIFMGKRVIPLKGGLKDLKEGDDVTVTRGPETKEDPNPIVTEIQVKTNKRPKKKNN